MPRLLIVIQTGDDGFGNPFRLVGTAHRDRNNTCFFGRIVVSSHEQGITYENHLFQRNAQEVPQRV